MVGTPYGGRAKGAIGLHRGMPSDDAHTAACDDRGVSPEFIHCDAALIVAAKPAGLLAVPGRGEDKQDCLAARVQAVYPDALVVHAMLERSRRGQSLKLPAGVPLSDFIPPERRHEARHIP